MRYTLDNKKFKQRVLSCGYRTVSEFALKNTIHRNTMQNLLRGRSVFLRSFEKIAKMLDSDPLELLLPTSPLPASVPHIDELSPLVAKLVQRHPKMAVVLLGSRAKRQATTYSDWDLGLFSLSKPISGMQYLRLKRAVEEWSEDLVRKVDCVNLHQAPIWFLENMQGGMIFLDGDRESFVYLQGLLDGIQREKQAA